tara:strand:- start:2961 stop:3062 length:102 start_codon:yes stop_codon:yes gene_type:complete
MDIPLEKTTQKLQAIKVRTLKELKHILTGIDKM